MATNKGQVAATVVNFNRKMKNQSKSSSLTALKPEEYSTLSTKSGFNMGSPLVTQFFAKEKSFPPHLREQERQIRNLCQKKISCRRKRDRKIAQGIKNRVQGKGNLSSFALYTKEIKELNQQILQIRQEIINIINNVQDRLADQESALEEVMILSCDPVEEQPIKHAQPNRHKVPSIHPYEKKRKFPQVKRKSQEGPRGTIFASRSESPSRFDLPVDATEPIYCLCRQVSYGEMVACDNPRCKYEWFHFKCVAITENPQGVWHCPLCRDKMAKTNHVLEPYQAQDNSLKMHYFITNNSQMKHQALRIETTICVNDLTI